MPDQNGNSFQDPADNDSMVHFSVMPQGGSGQDRPQPEPVDASDIERESRGIWQSKATYLVVGLLVLVILGALAYFLLWSGPKQPEQPANRLPNVFLQQYFGSQTCLDLAYCGETADPDQDGLSNYSELAERTDPTNPDTDGDGLSDGDERNVYLTDPLNKFTDPRQAAMENNYTDGLQIKNNYDPLTPGLKMNEARLRQIEQATTSFGLHEPTATTLSSDQPEPATVSVNIAGGKFVPQTVTVKINDTVLWLNQDAANRQIASDPHPAHDALPGLESGLLGSNQTFSFTFTQTGTFTYHDHLNPQARGTVIVETQP